MAGTYYQIEEAEMREFMQQHGFKEISVPGTHEIVFGKRVDQDQHQLTLRVYSSLIPGRDAKGCGEDAIRCVLFWRSPSGEKISKIGGSKRVHRVQNWKANLAKRIEAWLNSLPEHSCDRCGAPMTLKENRSTKKEFLACVNYPECRNTRSV